jgi:SAM-dependent methyltransferase
MPQPHDDDTGATDLLEAVRSRYSEGAATTVPQLCCPVDYDPTLLEAIPAEVIERDYGCGDPSRHLRPGETVLDLGSGTGKICFIASQVVGPEGRVIGVDMNDDMLAVARRAAPVVAGRVGHDNVTFLKGLIEDLALDREAFDRWLAEHPVTGEAGFAAAESHMAAERANRPLVADDSIDVVVSNCVLNLVTPGAKPQLFRELFRVLKRGGRAVISDIVCDEDVPAALQADPELWSGCISGALREDAFLEAFLDAGFHGIEVLERGAEPWQVVDGLEFRSVTVQAWKGKQGPCLEQGHAVIYKGPWSRVEDDDGHTYVRGVPMAVCGKTYRLMTEGPYASSVVGLEPALLVSEASAAPFACTGSRRRPAAELKGSTPVAPTGPGSAAKAQDGPATTDACCEPGTCC